MSGKRKEKPGDDLFGRPPAPERACPYCGQNAEPFLADGSCWRCAHDGQRAFCLRPILSAEKFVPPAGAAGVRVYKVHEQNH